MASKQSQRIAARQQLQQRMAEKAEQQHKKRNASWAVGGVGALVALALLAWGAFAVFGDDEEGGSNGADDGAVASLVDAAAAEADRCDGVEPSGEGKTAEATEGNTDGMPAKDVYLECAQISAPDGSATEECMYTATEGGETPQGTEPAAGKQELTFVTNLGKITADIDTEAAPCTAGSFTHLAQAGYFDDSQCHRLTTDGIFVLQCGDPDARAAIEAGTPEMAGQGSPGYQFGEENTPVEAEANYPAGTIAMANAGPDTTGSQFFIVYDDTTLPADYTILGQITSGLELVQDVAAAGSVEVAVPGM